MTNQTIQTLVVGPVPVNHPLLASLSANSEIHIACAHHLDDTLRQTLSPSSDHSIDVILLPIADVQAVDWVQLNRTGLPVIALCPDDNIGQQTIARGAVEYLLNEAISPGNLRRFCEMVVRFNRMQHNRPSSMQHGAENGHDSSSDVLRKAVEHSPASIIITDPDGLIQYVNPKFTQLTGYELHEVIHQTPRLLKSGHTSPTEYEALWKTVKSGGEWRGEFHNRKKNGALYWEQASISPVYNARGEITHMVAVKEDITERKRVEEELVASEMLRRAMFERHSAIKLIIDADTGEIVDANPAACRFYGYTQEQLISMTIQQINTLSPEAVAAERQRALREERNYFQFRHRLADGSLRDIESYAFPLHIGERNLLYSIVHDITDRVEAERQVQQLNEQLVALNHDLEAAVCQRTEQLQRTSDRLTAILDSVSEAIVTIDENNNFESVNQAFVEMFGQIAVQANIPTSTLIVRDYLRDFLDALRQVRTNGIPIEIEVRGLHEDGGAFDLDCTLSQERHNGRIVCTLRDITRLKEAGRIKDRFVSMVNHELRTPITAITLASSLLRKYYDRMSDEKRLSKIDQISEQARIMAELIESILDLSRLDTSAREREYTQTNVCPIVTDVIRELQASSEYKQQQLTLTCADTECCYIEADHQDVKRIWRNLIGNAIKYTPNGGLIQIRVGSVAVDDSGNLQPDIMPSLDASAGLKPGRYLVGQIEDNGPGIPPEDLDQLFSRFYRGWAAASHIPGSGLGLALVKEVLAYYGGDITVRSRVGEGTCFTLFIPKTVQSVVAG